jgi:regulator of sigma E protease
MTLLAIDWSTVPIQAAQFIASFSILILLHEFGHFITAKWFGCRVEKFYLFFNPWFSLFKKKKGETEYGIGWIPLGGYVKISGMIDESMDKEQMKLPPQPYEFRSKPAWQRLIIMLGGVIINVILAIIIFVFILWVWGKDYLPPANAKYGLATDSLAKSVGLKDGDVVLKVDTTTLRDVNTIKGQIVLNEARSLTIKRADSIIVLKLDEGLVRKLNTRSSGDFTGVRIPFIVKKIQKGSNAEKTGLLPEDRIVAINNTETPYFHEVRRAIKDKKNQDIQVKFLRANDTITKTIRLDDKARFGIEYKQPEDLGIITENEKYNFFEAIPAGFKECWVTLGRYITGFRQLFTGKAKASESLGSVLSIGGIYPPFWDWKIFWTLTAIFSIILAFMNILPIPGLDGGHALFTVAEMVTGRKPSDKFLEYAQMVGMVLLMGLMAYALGLDVWRLFK